MPYTMNGIGTWYYGKKNVFNYTDFCPHCGRYVTLSSYDTREWIVVLFIPIIPFGKKRILNSCPVCTKHKQMSLKKYMEAKQAAYQKADEACEQRPNDPDAAAQLLQVFSAYQDINMFDEATPAILQHFPNNAKLLNTVGVINYQYNRMDKARDYLEQSLAIHDDVEIRHLLGFVHARLGNPDAAAGYFQHILDKPDREKAPSLLALVDAFQAQGRHQDALVWLEHIARLSPEMEQNKDYKKSLKLSVKNKLSGKPILSKQLASAAGGKTPVSGKRAWGIAALVCAIVFAIFCISSIYMSRRANVFLVNGLNRPYEAILNGKAYTLEKSGYQKITLAEGNVDLRVNDASLAIDPAVLKVKNSFWKRPFANRLYVINPDAVAFIEWTKVFYHENINLAGEPEWKLYHGKQLHIFDGIHCAFEDLPEKIKVSNTDSGSRQQVQLFDKSAISPEYLPNVVEEFFGYEARIAHLKKMIYYEPENVIQLLTFYQQSDPQTFIETVRPGLEVLPARVEWHRCYQNAVDRSSPDHDLAAEYKIRLEKSPDDAGLMYLYARVLNDDPAESKQWLVRSIQSASPAAYGYYGIGIEAMMRADFPQASTNFEKALLMEPANPGFRISYYEMLLAQKQLEAACLFCEKQLAEDPKAYFWMQELTYVLNLQGNRAKSGEVFEEWCGRNQEIYAQEDIRRLRKAENLTAAYLAGDFGGIEKAIGEPNDLNDKVVLTLSGPRAISNDLMAQADSFSTMWQLLFYISESRLGNLENAELFLTQACEHFGRGDYEERYLAACLKGEAKIDPEKICWLPMERSLKMVALTSLGTRFPEHRERFFQLARQLNYKKVFPFHFIDAVCRTDSADAPAAAAAEKPI